MKILTYIGFSTIRFILLSIFAWYFTTQRFDYLVQFTQLPEHSYRCAQCLDAAFRNPDTYFEFASCASRMSPAFQRQLRMNNGSLLSGSPGYNLQTSRTAGLAQSLFITPVTVVLSVVTLFILVFYFYMRIPNHAVVELDELLSLKDTSVNSDDDNDNDDDNDGDSDADNDNHNNNSDEERSRIYRRGGEIVELDEVREDGDEFARSANDRTPLRINRFQSPVNYGSMRRDDQAAPNANANANADADAAAAAAAAAAVSAVNNGANIGGVNDLSHIQVGFLKSLHIVTWSLALLILSSAAAFSTMMPISVPVSSNSFIDSNLTPLFSPRFEPAPRVERVRPSALMANATSGGSSAGNNTGANLLHSMASWFDNLPLYVESTGVEGAIPSYSNHLIALDSPEQLILASSDSPSSSSDASSSGSRSLPRSFEEAYKLSTRQQKDDDDDDGTTRNQPLAHCVISTVPPFFMRWMDTFYSMFIVSIVILFFFEDNRLSSALLAVTAACSVVCMGFVGIIAMTTDAWISRSWESALITILVFIAFSEVPYLAYPLEKRVGVVDFPRLDAVANPVNTMMRLLLGSQVYRVISSVFSLLLNRFLTGGIRGL